MATQEATIELLTGCPLFSRLKRRQLQALVSSAKQREFESGAAIVKEGDSGLGFYLILSGRVEVRKGPRRLRELGPGDFFGEMALLDGAPRSADVVAMEPTECLILTSWELHGVISTHPSVAVEMLGEVARRLRDTDRSLTE
ncbi:MAG: cyclic nucleotide-binding domain-containing protein [Actinomycetota bacterium]|nr:cyclic nucleotide-binding domain-containing protein [Actinomycetota bacterium]